MGRWQSVHQALGGRFGAKKSRVAKLLQKQNVFKAKTNNKIVDLSPSESKEARQWGKGCHTEDGQ